LVTLRNAFAWAVLIAAGAAGALLLRRLGVPAPWLIAPLVLAIVAAVTGLVELRVPHPVFVAAQAAVGMLIAQSFTPLVIGSIARSWMVMILVVASTIAAAAIAGWILARFGAVPAPTAAWGSAPGGASAMTLMSADYGADPRIVAFMQYLRVTLVVLSASVVSRVLLPGGAHPAAIGAAQFDPVGFAGTIVVGSAGALAAIRLRIPAGALLGPMVLGAVLHGTGLVRIAIPAELLDAAYVAIGLTIGLQYTPATVRYALRILPQLLASTLVLIALCAGSAALLALAVRVDPLTAYLATTPGGLDSVTVIALGSGANVPLVLAVQALRVFVVILTGPSLAKLVARVAS
jgi:membrane AbrB-like protein